MCVHKVGLKQKQAEASGFITIKLMLPHQTSDDADLPVQNYGHKTQVINTTLLKMYNTD